MLKKVEYVDPKGISKSIMAWILREQIHIHYAGQSRDLVAGSCRVDSGCSSHMTGNKAYLSDYEDYNGGFVDFGSDPKGGKITGKGKIRTANLEFDDVYFVYELKFNLFSISQMCDKKNSVLFTETECLILSLSFKLLDESQVVLRAPRKDDVYSLDLKNIIPFGGITCLYANATADESKLWHRRLGHVNFKNINKLVKGHLVRGLPSKVFMNDHTCVACKKGKQHKASYQHATQPDPSPRPLPTIPIPNSIPEGSGRNHGGQSPSDRSLSVNEDGLTLQSVYDLCMSLCKQVTDQAKEIKHLKAQIKKLKKKAKPVITHHKAWMKSGRKPAKAEPTMHKDPAFDDLDDIVDDAIDYMESEDAQDEGRTSFVVLEEKKSTDKSKVSTDKPEVSTAKPKEVEVSTDKLDKGTADLKDGTSDESIVPTTVFRDDETIAKFLVSMSRNKAKQKGVEIKDAEDSDRLRATSTRSVLTLKPLPKIDHKDKGKKVLEEEAESDAESEGARIKADRLLAARLQEEERETFTVEERAKFLYDTIVAHRRFLHVGGKKHADLKNKNFEEIQVMYKKVKRSDKDFNMLFGSSRDERQIKEMNEESKDPKRKMVVNETPREEDTVKVPIEQEVTEQGIKKRKSSHVKMIARKRPRP
ncbi:ribonuclease H-like domain-containing protein [Tanacetum coccineum]